jgi:hypothetical protein
VWLSEQRLDITILMWSDSKNTMLFLKEFGVKSSGLEMQAVQNEGSCFYPKPCTIGLSHCYWTSENPVIMREYELDDRGTSHGGSSEPGRYLAPPSLLSRGYFGEKDVKTVIPLGPPPPSTAWCSALQYPCQARWHTW